MRARLQRFLLALLVLVLPLQGIAFASMLDMAFASRPAAPEQMTLPDAMMAGCHDHHGRQDAPPAQHNCKHCAACAFGSALPVPVAGSLAIPPVSRSFASHPDTLYSGFVPDGPERPPRTHLA